jgi:hypothetical protein
MQPAQRSTPSTGLDGSGQRPLVTGACAALAAGGATLQAGRRRGAGRLLRPRKPRAGRRCQQPAANEQVQAPAVGHLHLKQRARARRPFRQQGRLPLRLCPAGRQGGRRRAAGGRGGGCAGRAAGAACRKAGGSGARGGGPGAGGRRGGADQGRRAGAFSAPQPGRLPGCQARGRCGATSQTRPARQSAWHSRCCLAQQGRRLDLQPCHDRLRAAAPARAQVGVVAATEAVLERCAALDTGAAVAPERLALLRLLVGGPAACCCCWRWLAGWQLASEGTLGLLCWVVWQDRVPSVEQQWRQGPCFTSTHPANPYAPRLPQVKALQVEEQQAETLAALLEQLAPKPAAPAAPAAAAAAAAPAEGKGEEEEGEEAAAPPAPPSPVPEVKVRRCAAAWQRHSEHSAPLRLRLLVAPWPGQRPWRRDWPAPKGPAARTCPPFHSPHTHTPQHAPRTPPQPNPTQPAPAQPLC